MTSIKNNKEREDFSSSYTTSKNSPNKCVLRVLLYYSILLLLSSKPCKKNEGNIYDQFTRLLLSKKYHCLGSVYTAQAFTMYQLVLVFCFQCKYHMVYTIDNIPSHFTIMQIIMCFCQCLRKPLMPTDPFYQNPASQYYSTTKISQYRQVGIGSIFTIIYYGCFISSCLCAGLVQSQFILQRTGTSTGYLVHNIYALSVVCSTVIHVHYKCSINV